MNNANTDLVTAGATVLLAPTKVNDFRANWSRNTDAFRRLHSAEDSMGPCRRPPQFCSLPRPHLAPVVKVRVPSFFHSAA